MYFCVCLLYVIIIEYSPLTAVMIVNIIFQILAIYISHLTCLTVDQ